MLRAIVIGEGTTVQETLLKILNEIPFEIEIEASFSTVKESISHLSNFSNADIIFSDVKLQDGLAFEIFSQTSTNLPVIFVAAYDEFMLNALKYIGHNYIEHLLNKTNRNEVDKLYPKYQVFEKLFVASNSSLKTLLNHVIEKKKERLQVRKGLENILLYLQDIVLIYTENRLVFVIDQSGKKYMVDKTLTELEEELDNDMFFRANRQYIVNINYVKGFKSYERVKLLVDLNSPALPNHCIVVSQKTAPAFRKWVYDA